MYMHSIIWVVPQTLFFFSCYGVGVLENGTHRTPLYSWMSSDSAFNSIIKYTVDMLKAHKTTDMPTQKTIKFEVSYADRRIVTKEVVTVDRAVWEWAQTHHWVLLSGKGKKPYVVCGADIYNHPTYLHREAFRILHGADALSDRNLVVDHISGDVFDCTGANIRLLTRSENSMNRPKGIYKRKCGSQHKGVWRRVNKSKKTGELTTAYTAEIKVKNMDGKKRTKTFSEKVHGDQAETMAARWYNEQATALVGGGVARLNQL
jgi:hypothetical protein